MSNHIVEWCRRQQDRFNTEGKPYTSKLMGLMAGYFKRQPPEVKCGICGSSFAYDKYPETGDSMNCPHCDAEGYGTYDQGGYYMLEWYEGENGS